MVMPRPRVLKDARVVPIVLDHDLYQAAKATAGALGISLSQLIRDALAQYIDEVKIQMGIKIVFNTAVAADGQVAANKIDMIEAEEFEDRLSGLESYVNDIEKQLESVDTLLAKPQLLDWSENRDFAIRWLRKAENAVDWFYKLKSDYQRLRARRATREGWDMRLYEVWFRLKDVRTRKNSLARLLERKGIRV